VDEEDIPKTECLKDTEERIAPYFDDEIAPEIKVDFALSPYK